MVIVEPRSHFALVVSAGSGQRFGSHPPKQFQTISGKTVLEICIENLTATRIFRHICVAVPAEWIMEAKQALSQEVLSGSVSITTGGQTRRESIANLVDHLGKTQTSLSGNITVTLLDANRPLTSERVLRENLDNAILHGASCPVIPITNGTAFVDGDAMITSVPSKENIVQIVTPETATWATLQAIENSTRSSETLLGLAEMYTALGHSFGSVEGDRFCFKITNPEDWPHFKALYEERIASGDS